MSSIVSLRVPLLVATLMLVGAAAASAQAEDKRPSEHYDQAVVDYKLGRFEKAAAGFERAYELDPDPLLLFNIAQARRHLATAGGVTEIERAIFFYERYLADAPAGAKAGSARNHLAELRGRLAEARAAVQAAAPAEDAAAAPASAPSVPGPAADSPAAAPQGEADALAPLQPGPLAPPALVESSRPPAWRPAMISVALAGGPGWPAFGRSDLALSMMPSLTVGVGAGWRVGRAELGLGLVTTHARLGYHRADGASRTSYFPGLFVAAGAALTLGRGFALLARAGGGVTWWTGLEAQNPFTPDGVAATGAVPLAALRVAAGVRRSLGDSLFVAVLPALIAARRSGGLNDSVRHVQLWSVLVELGYRL
jgi:tetratricopeptide (TPR) repeat protein